MERQELPTRRLWAVYDRLPMLVPWDFRRLVEQLTTAGAFSDIDATAVYFEAALTNSL
jgi:hypothetical protein